MTKYISYNKLSKKEQKKINATKRKSWREFGCISPVSRVVVDKKKQNNKTVCRFKNRNHDND